MHAAAIRVIHRLWHKCCMQSMTAGNSFACHAKCHYIIGCRKRIHWLQINLMLIRGMLMIGASDINSHILKRKNNISSYILACIKRCHIKIRSMSLRLQHHLSVCIIWKQTKFTLWSNIRINSHLGCLTDNPF